jgi:hypothetical protein
MVTVPKLNAQGEVDRWGGQAEATAPWVLGSKVIVTIGYITKCCGYHAKNNIFLVIAQPIFKFKLSWYYFVLKKKRKIISHLVPF